MPKLGYKQSEEHRRKISESNKDKPFSVAHRKKLSESEKGEKNHKWKGDNAGKLAMHSWVERQKGKASTHKCVDCNEQALDWSNVDHSYKRRLKDYSARCRSCHYRYDRKNNLKKK